MFSTTRPAPPSGGSSRFAFSRYYNYNLRPAVIGTAVAGAIWSLVWGISNFQNINDDKSQHLNKLVPFDIILGALYMGVAVVELFGIGAAAKQNLGLMRIYSLLSLVAVAVAVGAAVVRIVVHFKFKSDLINECATFLQNNSVNVGRNGQISNVTAAEALNVCQNQWDRDTFADIAWFIVSIVVGLVFSSIAFSYYRQLLDPTSVASRMTRDPVNNYPLNTFPGAEPRYNPPPGPPPQEYIPPYDATKLPGYGFTGTQDSDMGKGDEKVREGDVGTSHS